MKRIDIILVLAFGITACADWLDVQPKTAIPGDKMFESEAGFKDVLTGFLFEDGFRESVCQRIDVRIPGTAFGEL